MKNIYHICTLALAVALSSCDSFMDPNDDEHIGVDDMTASRDYFVGELYRAYSTLPNRFNFYYEAASDNAVANNEGHASSRAARGGLTLQDNPLGNNWEADYRGINRANWYIEHNVLNEDGSTPVIFDLVPSVNMEKFHFTTGEAYFLRAWYEFDLLQKYGGVADDGEVYGFPLSLSYLEATDRIPNIRDTYDRCVEQIVADCDKAIELLPWNYTVEQGAIKDGTWMYTGHASGMAAGALKARALLYAASDAYNVTNDTKKWEDAAKAAAEVINHDGLRNLMSLSDYTGMSKINDNNYDNADIFFRGPVMKDAQTYESENFMPRLGGNATFTPTQNLVDAFPMADGFPKNDPGSSYLFDVDNPFKDRDSRLDAAVVRTRENFAGLDVNTSLNGPDGYGTSTYATRTGYYLQKWVNGNVRLVNPMVRCTYIVILLGRPELYLNFAEAAVRATGSPDAAIGGLTARQVLQKIRDRALGTGKDRYLPTVTSGDAFLDVVKNERRIELCFEDHRFWDLRRWNDLEAINAPVHGMYSDSPVETRSFRSVYMPLPYGELLKPDSKLINNKGWN